MKLVIATFEGADRTPILTHTFEGRSKVDIMGIVKAHVKYDEFFCAAMTTQRFKGIVLRNEIRWKR